MEAASLVFNAQVVTLSNVPSHLFKQCHTRNYGGTALPMVGAHTAVLGSDGSLGLSAASIVQSLALSLAASLSDACAATPIWDSST